MTRVGRRREFCIRALWLLLFAAVSCLFWTGGRIEAASQTSEEGAEEEPAAPALKAAKAGDGKITVTWQKVKGASSYLIYRREEGEKYRKTATLSAADGVTYEDDTVRAGRTYTYTVKARSRVDGGSRVSACDREGVTAQARVPRVSLSKIQAGSGKITLTWQKVPDISRYRIYRKEEGGKYKKLADVKAGVLRYVDETAERGHTYTYTVRALVTAGGTTAQGSVDRTGLTATVPVKKTTLEQVEPFGGFVSLTWKRVSGVDGYLIYRRKEGAKTYTRLARIANAARTLYWDRSAKPGTVYTYAICSYMKVDGKVVRSQRTVWEEDVTGGLGTPILLSLTKGSSKDRLTWTSVSGAEGYIVYRKNDKTGGKWEKAASVSAGTTSARVARDEEGTTTYTVRAWMTLGNKKLYSAFLDTLDNSDKKYTKTSILFEGDSVTRGRTWSGKEAAVSYPERVAAITGARIDNEAVRGSTLAQGVTSNAKSVVGRAKKGTVSYEGYSVICLAIGTNDYGKNVPLGKAGDTSAETFCGALETWFGWVREQNPDAKVVLITPTYRGRVGTDYRKAGMNCKNSAGFTLQDYADALKTVGAEYGAVVYDSSEAGVITPDNANIRLCDALHPLDEGYCEIGKSVASFLMKKVLTKDE